MVAPSHRQVGTRRGRKFGEDTGASGYGRESKDGSTGADTIAGVAAENRKPGQPKFGDDTRKPGQGRYGENTTGRR